MAFLYRITVFVLKKQNKTKTCCVISVSQLQLKYGDEMQQLSDNVYGQPFSGISFASNLTSFFSNNLLLFKY